MIIREIKLKIRAFLWKLLGGHDTSAEVRNLQDQVDALHFFLNTLHDVRTVSPATDEDLRILQLCDAQLLIIIDKICKKHHLNYWLDYGTLLGAYRHKGFIPWDDDTDISMLRSDYNQMVEIVNTELGRYGIKAAEADGRIGIGYRHQETGVWVDIFAVDTYNSSDDYSTEEDRLHKMVNDYKSNSIKKNGDFQYSEIAILLREKLKEQALISGNKYLFRCPGYYGPEFIYKEEDIFPLSRLSFEGYLFSVPNKTTTCLTQYYSEKYMSFPKSGVLHHGIRRVPLSTWAKDHNIDMKMIHKQLKEITNIIT